jgi:hypothetical protein
MHNSLLWHGVEERLALCHQGVGDHRNFAQIRPVYAMMNPGALVAGKGNALLRVAYLRVCQMLRALVRGGPGGGDYPCP